MTAHKARIIIMLLLRPEIVGMERNFSTNIASVMRLITAKKLGVTPMAPRLGTKQTINENFPHE
jgi:hypothetical protein